MGSAPLVYHTWARLCHDPLVGCKINLVHHNEHKKIEYRGTQNSRGVAQYEGKCCLVTLLFYLCLLTSGMVRNGVAAGRRG